MNNLLHMNDCTVVVQSLTFPSETQKNVQQVDLLQSQCRAVSLDRRETARKMFKLRLLPFNSVVRSIRSLHHAEANVLPTSVDRNSNEYQVKHLHN